jgi:hypothetical protein
MSIMYVRCESVLGHSRTSLTCAYLFASAVQDDESAGHTGIRVQVPLSDTDPLRMLRCPSVLRLTPSVPRLPIIRTAERRDATS